GLPPASVFAHGIPDVFVEHGPQALQRHRFGLDPAGIVATLAERFPDLVRGTASPAAPAPGAVAETVHWA
ncbi:MAG TPA: hypothetical protein VMN04_01735, partial [Thermoanaerobaculia bacterium]|nr:hypothetical protein [Thermoanaerobaculia bacterium]